MVTADAVVDEREDAVDVLLGPNVVVGKSDIANARAQCQDWAQRRRLANASDDARELPSEGASGSADFAIVGDGVEEARSGGGPDERRAVRRKSGVEALEDDASSGEEGLVFLDVDGDVPLAKRGDGVGNVVGDAVGTFIVFG